MQSDTATLLAGALDWASKGIAVFPCGGNKAPLTKNGFYDAETDATKVKALFDFYGDRALMIGARMGEESGLFCMDFDLYKGDEPKEYMEKLMREGSLPDSRVHQTMSGGLHVFYYSETEWPNTKPCAGVEVKGEGGYVIVPPSPGYSVYNDMAVTDAPDALLKALAIAKDVASTASVDELQFAVMEASDFHDSLRGIAARLSATGMSPVDVVLALKKLLSASAASDPKHTRHSRWQSLVMDKGQELTRIVKSGYVKYNPEAASNRVREFGNSEWEDTAEAVGFYQSPEKGKPEIEYSDAEWPFTDGYFADEEHNLAEQNFTMYPIFAEHESVVLFAEPKVGKTAFALATALSIACGFDLGSLKVAVGGPTLYYGLEGTRAIRLRVAAWKKRKREAGVEIPKRIPMYVVEGQVNFLKEDRRKDEAAKIIAANANSVKNGLGPLKAIYLDTLTKAMSGGDQNSVEDTSHLFDLIGLLREGGVSGTIIFIHHKSRQGNARGSTNIEAEPDVLLDISKEGPIITLRVARARSIEDGEQFRFRLEGVDLGETSQGFPLTGVYIEPEPEIAEDTHSGASMENAKRYSLIVGLGAGTHTLQTVQTTLAAEKLGAKDARGSKQVSAKAVMQVRVQQFYNALLTNTGVVYANYALSLDRDKDEKIIGINVSPLRGN
jgi:hypothetical protein